MDNPITLKFKRSGGGYSRAKEVADFLNLEIEEYLLKCIERGHKDYAAMVDVQRTLPEGLRPSSDELKAQEGKGSLFSWLFNMK